MNISRQPGRKIAYPPGSETAGILELAALIRECQPDAKIRSDTMAAKVFYRPLSYYSAAFLWRVFALAPNMVSLLAGLMAVAAAIAALVFPSAWLVAVLLLLAGTFDCADGALARYLQTVGPRGELADAIGGYIVLCAIPYITWLMMYRPDALHGQRDLVLGVVTGAVVSFHCLGRSVYLKKKLTDDVNGKLSSIGETGLLHRVNTELSFCGFMVPAIIISWSIGWPLAGWIYAIAYTALGGIAGMAVGIKTTYRASA